MKVLIVGGTGVISTAVVNEAVKRGIEVTCINRGNDHGNVKSEGVETLHIDVRDKKKAIEVLEGRFFDVVVDFICAKGTDAQYSLNLFYNKCKQYVFISTDSVYKIKEDGHYDESCIQPNEEWDYSYMKSECEDVVRAFCKEKGLPYTIVRPSITYGNTRIPYGFMPPVGYHYTLIERIKKGKPVVLWNGGQNIQTFMRVEDFAVGMVGLWGNTLAYNQDFNICGESYSWNNVLEVIEKILGKKAIRVDIPLQSIIEKFPERRGEFLIDRAQDHYVSNMKLKSVLPHFSITISLEEGIAQTIHYYESNNNIFGIDYHYDGLCDMLIQPFYNDKLSFIPYDSKPNKFSYYLGRFDDSFPVKVYTRTMVFSQRVLRKLKRIAKHAINK